jgi:tetratricopeptide (TPR) repeat protein
MATLALLHGAQAAGQLEQWEESLNWLEELMTQFPQSRLLPQARFEQAQAQRQLGKLDAALELYTAVAEEQRNELGARARFLMGELRFERKEYGDAVREFQRVVLGFGGAEAPESIKPWQARAGLEAGRCFELLASQERDAGRRDEYIRRAQQYFRYVVTDHPQVAEAAAARRHLEKYN